MRLSICIVLFLALFIPSARAAHMLLTSIPSALASHWSGWWGWVEHDFTGYGGKPIMDIWGPFLSEGDCQRALSEFMTGFRYVEDFDCEWTDKMSY